MADLTPRRARKTWQQSASSTPFSAERLALILEARQRQTSTASESSSDATSYPQSPLSNASLPSPKVENQEPKYPSGNKGGMYSKLKPQGGNVIFSAKAAPVVKKISRQNSTTASQQDSSPSSQSTISNRSTVPRRAITPNPAAVSSSGRKLPELPVNSSSHENSKELFQAPSTENCRRKWEVFLPDETSPTASGVRSIIRMWRDKENQHQGILKGDKGKSPASSTRNRPRSRFEDNEVFAKDDDLANNAKAQNSGTLGYYRSCVTPTPMHRFSTSMYDRKVVMFEDHADPVATSSDQDGFLTDISGKVPTYLSDDESVETDSGYNESRPYSDVANQWESQLSPATSDSRKKHVDFSGDKKFADGEGDGPTVKQSYTYDGILSHVLQNKDSNPVKGQVGHAELPLCIEDCVEADNISGQEFGSRLRVQERISLFESKDQPATLPRTKPKHNVSSSSATKSSRDRNFDNRPEQKRGVIESNTLPRNLGKQVGLPGGRVDNFTAKDFPIKTRTKSPGPSASRSTGRSATKSPVTVNAYTSSTLPRARSKQLPPTPANNYGVDSPATLLKPALKKKLPETPKQKCSEPTSVVRNSSRISENSSTPTSYRNSRSATSAVQRQLAKKQEGKVLERKADSSDPGMKKRSSSTSALHKLSVSPSSALQKEMNNNKRVITTPFDNLGKPTAAIGSNPANKTNISNSRTDKFFNGQQPTRSKSLQSFKELQLQNTTPKSATTARVVLKTPPTIVTSERLSKTGPGVKVESNATQPSRHYVHLSPVSPDSYNDLFSPTQKNQRSREPSSSDRNEPENMSKGASSRKTLTTWAQTPAQQPEDRLQKLFQNPSQNVSYSTIPPNSSIMAPYNGQGEKNPSDKVFQNYQSTPSINQLDTPLGQAGVSPASRSSNLYQKRRLPSATKEKEGSSSSQHPEYRAKSPSNLTSWSSQGSILTEDSGFSSRRRLPSRPKSPSSLSSWGSRGSLVRPKQSFRELSQSIQRTLTPSVDHARNMNQTNDLFHTGTLGKGISEPNIFKSSQKLSSYNKEGSPAHAGINGKKENFSNPLSSPLSPHETSSYFFEKPSPDNFLSSDKSQSVGNLVDQSHLRRSNSLRGDVHAYRKERNLYRELGLVSKYNPETTNYSDNFSLFHV